MPLWVKIYLLLFLLLVVWGEYSNYKELPRPYLLIYGILNDVLLVLLGCTYWFLSWANLIKSFDKTLLGLSLVMSITLLYLQIKKTLPYPELSKGGNLFMGISIAIILILVVTPLYYWAFLQIVFDKYSVT